MNCFSWKSSITDDDIYFIETYFLIFYKYVPISLIKNLIKSFSSVIQCNKYKYPQGGPFKWWIKNKLYR